MPPCMHTSDAPRSHASVTRPRDLRHLEIIGPSAQVLAHLALGECAERLAFERADVGVVDVARDDVAHNVAIHLAAQIVGRTADRGKVIAARPEQGDDFALVQALAARCALSSTGPTLSDGITEGALLIHSNSCAGS